MKKYIEKISTRELMSLREDQREKIALFLKEKIEDAILLAYRVEDIKDPSEYNNLTSSAIRLSLEKFNKDRNVVVDNPLSKDIGHKMSLDLIKFSKIFNEHSREHQRNVINHLLTAYQYSESFMESVSSLNLNNPEIGAGKLANLKSEAEKITSIAESERLRDIVKMKVELNIGEAYKSAGRKI